MIIIDLKIVVPEVHADLTSDFGLSEKAYISLSNILGDAGIGEILDCKRIAAPVAL